MFKPVTVLSFTVREVLVYPLFYFNTVCNYPCLPTWQPLLTLLFSP